MPEYILKVQRITTEEAIVKVTAKTMKEAEYAAFSNVNRHAYKLENIEYLSQVIKPKTSPKE